MRKSKKLLSFIIILIIVLLSTGAFAESETVNKFKDIKSTDWHSKTIENLMSKGIIDGYNDYTFRPNKEVTVAEFLKLSMEVSGIKYDNTMSPWHKDLMNKALNLGIITKELYNSPDAPIKRKDVAVVLTKLIEKTDLKDEFINERSKEYDRFKYLLYDTTKLSREYRDSIYKLFEYQLIVGTTNNKDQVFYNPDSNLTRAEIATIIERLIEPSKRLEKYSEYPNRNNIFVHEDIDNMTSTAFHIKPNVDKQKFLYSYEELGVITRDVALSEKLNPNINKQIYELTKATIDKEHYVFTKGLAYDKEDSSIISQFAKTELHAINNNNFWSFIFDEKQPFNVKENTLNEAKSFSKDSIISLRLGKIWRDFAPDGWIDYFYANKLRASLIAIFGEKYGHEIYEYVLGEYVKYRLAGSATSTGYKYIYQTKEIGNVHIDLITGDNAILRFYFSYIK